MIGLFGGMNNNMYRYAKAFASNGLSVQLIRDPWNLLPHYQPCWEDIRLRIFDRKFNHHHFSLSEWRSVESQHGWEQPHWIVDPDKSSTSRMENPLSNMTLPDRLYALWRFGSNRPRRPSFSIEAIARNILRAMQSHQLLLVSGVEAELLASFSGVPYAIVPHGSDMSWAMGDYTVNPEMEWWGRKDKHVIHWLLKRAFRKSWRVFGHNPSSRGHLDPKVAASLSEIPMSNLPLPQHRSERPATKPLRHQHLLSVAEELELSLPPADFYALIPSRLEFQVKGQDRFLRALSRLRGKGSLHVLAADWGANRKAIKALLTELGIEDRVSFLPGFVSQPILLDLMRGADFVVDHFLYGAYGGIVIEASSCGTPTMTWIEREHYTANDRLPPPTLAAQTTDHIESVLNQIVNGTLSLDAFSIQVQEWFSATHWDRTVAEMFCKYLSTDFPALYREPESTGASNAPSATVEEQQKEPALH